MTILGLGVRRPCPCRIKAKRTLTKMNAEGDSVTRCEIWDGCKLKATQSKLDLPPNLTMMDEYKTLNSESEGRMKDLDVRCNQPDLCRVMHIFKAYHRYWDLLWTLMTRCDSQPNPPGLPVSTKLYLSKQQLRQHLQLKLSNMAGKTNVTSFGCSTNPPVCPSWKWN